MVVEREDLGGYGDRTAENGVGVREVSGRRRVGGMVVESHLHGLPSHLGAHPSGHELLVFNYTKMLKLLTRFLFPTEMIIDSSACMQGFP